MTLLDVLTLEEIEPDAFRAWTAPGSQRSDIFGGQVAGQALRAGGLTVDSGHRPHSVHCYFLRRGQPALPIDIEVERVRQGRTYTSRRIDVRQEGKTILAMLASFHADEPGREFDHQMPAGVPDPESLAAAGGGGGWESEVELRTVPVEAPTVQWWGRVLRPFVPDPLMHFCGLLYASDMRAGGAAMSAVGFGSGIGPPRDPEGERTGDFGSLDHALWFHRQPSIDDWFFCQVQPLTIRDSRGLVLGTMFDRAGRHLATFTQEVFMKEGQASRGPGA